ncbi:hypothetical protein PCE1_002497 [Barthelona sp. PCE]
MPRPKIYENGLTISAYPEGFIKFYTKDVMHPNDKLIIYKSDFENVSITHPSSYVMATDVSRFNESILQTVVFESGFYSNFFKNDLSQISVVVYSALNDISSKITLAFNLELGEGYKFRSLVLLSRDLVVYQYSNLVEDGVAFQRISSGEVHKVPGLKIVEYFCMKSLFFYDRNHVIHGYNHSNNLFEMGAERCIDELPFSFRRHSIVPVVNSDCVAFVQNNIDGIKYLSFVRGSEVINVLDAFDLAEIKLKSAFTSIVVVQFSVDTQVCKLCFISNTCAILWSLDEEESTVSIDLPICSNLLHCDEKVNVMHGVHGYKFTQFWGIYNKQSIHFNFYDKSHILLSIDSLNKINQRWGPYIVEYRLSNGMYAVFFLKNASVLLLNIHNYSEIDVIDEHIVIKGISSVNGEWVQIIYTVYRDGTVQHKLAGSVPASQFIYKRVNLAHRVLYNLTFCEEITKHLPRFSCLVTKDMGVFVFSRTLMKYVERDINVGVMCRIIEFDGFEIFGVKMAPFTYDAHYQLFIVERVENNCMRNAILVFDMKDMKFWFIYDDEVLKGKTEWLSSTVFRSNNVLFSVDFGIGSGRRIKELESSRINCKVVKDNFFGFTYVDDRIFRIRVEKFDPQASEIVEIKREEIFLSDFLSTAQIYHLNDYCDVSVHK